jgi:hypothetical protein
VKQEQPNSVRRRSQHASGFRFSGSLNSENQSEADGSLFHVAGYPITSGTAPGCAAVVTFPEKTPTPAPALPAWLALTLGVSLSWVGVRRLTPPARYG